MFNLHINDVLGRCWGAIQKYSWPTKTTLNLIASVLTFFVATYGVWYTKRGFDLQFKAYKDDAYQRQQSALSIASKTIGEANNVPYEVGQSRAIEFLLRNRAAYGRITLNNSSLAIGFFEDDAGVLPISLPYSSFCGTSIYFGRNSSGIDLSGSQLRSGSLSGHLDFMRAVGANMQDSVIANAWVRNASFIGSNLTNVTFRGGKFKYSDFQGADLSHIKTERGTVGLGSQEEDLYTEFSADSTSEAVIPGEKDYFHPIFQEKYSSAEALELANLRYRERPGDRIVDFTGAHFDHADLRGADLRNSNITQEQVNSACVDDTTQLPYASMRRPPCSVAPWVLDLRKAFSSPPTSDVALIANCAAALEGKPDRRDVAR